VAVALLIGVSQFGQSQSISQLASQLSNNQTVCACPFIHSIDQDCLTIHLSTNSA